MTEFATHFEVSEGGFHLKRLPAMDGYFTEDDDHPERSPNWVEDMNIIYFDDADATLFDDSEDDGEELFSQFIHDTQFGRPEIQASFGTSSERTYSKKRSFRFTPKKTSGKTAIRVRRAFDILRRVRAERTVTRLGVPVLTVERQFKSLRFNGCVSNVTIRRCFRRTRRKIVRQPLKVAA